MQNYELARMPRVAVGHPALAQLAHEVRALGGESVLLVLDPAVAASNYLEQVRQVLSSLPVTEFVAPPGEPVVGTIDRAAGLGRPLASPVVVGVGGGSALDTAKQVAGVMAGPWGIDRYLLCAQPWPGRRPIVAIPTTAGTGAEVTRTCIVSDTTGRKLWTWGDELLPDWVLLDPQVTATLPPALTAATGLDALVHALEAATAQRRNPLAMASALQALRLVDQWLVRAVEQGDDLAARQGMQEAALLAGVAIDNCGTGMAHCIGHALGTLYRLPHGVAVTLALQASLSWSMEGHQDIYRQPAQALQQEVTQLEAWFNRLLQQVGFGGMVAPLLAFTPEVVDLAQTMLAPENQPMLRNNARPGSAEVARDLAQRMVQLIAQYQGG